MNKYLVYAGQGAGGMFVSALLGLIHGYDISPEMSDTGDCHNMTGNGYPSIWANTQDFNFIGLYPTNFLPNRKIYYAHVIDIEKFKQQVPDAKIIFIECSADDIPMVTKFYVNKVWPIIWTEEEYNKWAGSSWPPYSPDNVTMSDVIRNELIADLSQTIIKPWVELNAEFEYDFCIPFKTVFALDKGNLADKLATITGNQITCNIQDFIVKYQELNKKLYIDE